MVAAVPLAVDVFQPEWLPVVVVDDGGAASDPVP
jgi:hypothetical protein